MDEKTVFAFALFALRTKGNDPAERKERIVRQAFEDVKLFFKVAQETPQPPR